MAPNTASDHATVEQMFKTHWNQAYAALQPLVSPEDDTPPRKEAIDQLAAAVVSSSILPLSFVLTGVLLFVERLRAYPLGHVCFPFGELGSGRVRDFLSLGGRSLNAVIKNLYSLHVQFVDVTTPVEYEDDEEDLPAPPTCTPLSSKGDTIHSRPVPKAGSSQLPESFRMTPLCVTPFSPSPYSCFADSVR
jgi:hypothetical protein